MSKIRPKFLSCAVSLSLSAACSVPAAAGTFVYVSNADDGDISTYTLKYDEGKLEPGARMLAGSFVMPMDADAKGRYLYASVRSEPWSVQSYRIHPDTGALTWVGSAPLPESMVHIQLDRTGRWLLSASYGANVLSVSAVGANGQVALEPTTVIPSGGVKPHSVRISKDNRFVIIPHLGTDEVRSYRFNADSGALDYAEPASTKVEKNTGPRHSEASADGRFLYVLGEMAGTVTVYGRNAQTGSLTQLQTVASQPADTKLIPGVPRAPSGPGMPPPPEGADRMIMSADIHITPNGRFLYTSERTGSTLSRFAVDQATGRLTLLGLTPTEKVPRGFAIDPDGRFLIAAGQESPTISLYAIDDATGDLTLKQQVPAGKGANWVEIVRTH